MVDFSRVFDYDIHFLKANDMLSDILSKMIYRLLYIIKMNIICKQKVFQCVVHKYDFYLLMGKMNYEMYTVIIVVGMK